MCFAMKYVQTTQHVFSRKRREYLAGKCSVVKTVSIRKHELSGMMDGRMMWCHSVMPQQLRNLTNILPELSRSRALTICSGIYLVDLHLLLCHSNLDLSSNQLQQLPPGVFSSLTSLRSLTCVVVCIKNVCVHHCV
jgi:hypothetical protein